jgi:hypothetical protein
MDELARAIAQSREASKDDKPGETPASTPETPTQSRLAQSVSRKVVAPPAFPSTKRPKKV